MYKFVEKLLQIFIHTYAQKYSLNVDVALIVR
jgi:hypothetical protein